MTITIKWLAHASFQIRTDDQVIYIDPSEKNTGLKGKGLPQADLILVTHGHYDHCDPGLLKKLRKFGSAILAPPSCKKDIKGVVWEMSPGEFMDISGGIKVRAVDAYNVKRFRSPGKPFHPKGEGVGYIITLEGKRIYHAGDTDLIPQMEVLGDIDVALLPSGDTYTMDAKEAAEAAVLIDPKVVIPMHTWSKDMSDFKQEVEGKSSVKVVVLKEGEEYTLD